MSDFFHSGEALGLRAALLPLSEDSPAVVNVHRAYPAEPLPRGRSRHASTKNHWPFRQQGWLRKAAAGSELYPHLIG